MRLADVAKAAGLSRSTLLYEETAQKVDQDASYTCSVQAAPTISRELYEVQCRHPSENPSHSPLNEVGLSVSVTQGPELGSRNQHIPRAFLCSGYSYQSRQ